MTPVAIEQSIFQSTLRRITIYPVVLLMALVAIFLLQLNNMITTADRVQHTDQVIAQVSTVLNLLVDMETGLRGYLLTQDTVFREPYEAADAMIDPQLAALHLIIRDDGAQESQLSQLETNIAQWRTFAREAIALNDSQPGLNDIGQQLSGKTMMDSIRQDIAAFIAVEANLRDQRTRETQRTTQSAIVFSIVAGLGFGGIIAMIVSQQVVHLSRSYETALEISNQQTQERIQLNDLLTHERTRLTDIIANVPGVIWETGTETPTTDQPALSSVKESNRLVFISDFIETLLGYSVVEATTPTTDFWQTILHPEDMELFQKAYAAPIQQRTPTIVTVRARSKPVSGVEEATEAYRHLEAYILPVMRGDRMIGTRGVLLDVTERQRLMTEQTRIQEALRASNEQLQQFAYIASHDLQEPLRMVTSYLNLIEKRYSDKLDADAHEFIGFAVEGASRMRDLIAGLLQYSRIDLGDGKEMAVIPLQRPLDNALKNLELMIAERQAVITQIPLPMLKADEIQMTQLFQNLIGNALKYCKDRVPQVHIGVTRQGSQWQFSVRDNGIGIPVEHQERVFIIFQRLHERGEYAGTGIGLAVCRRIVERHGGQIRLESVPGEGTTFFFTLPAKNS